MNISSICTDNLNIIDNDINYKKPPLNKKSPIKIKSEKINENNNIKYIPHEFLGNEEPDIKLNDLDYSNTEINKFEIEQQERRRRELNN